MGIRFERDTRRATNGPMIFFSILHDEVFEEEIRSAFVSGLSFYAYRLPGASMLTYGSSEGFVEGIGTPGFVIGLFSSRYPYITIPYEGVKTTGNPESLYTMPVESTPFEDYSKEVGAIINLLKAGKGEKVVAARVLVKSGSMDVADKFYEFCQRFPDAFVFCFSTPATGCWIGASPELLLEGKEGNLISMALAGTRPAGSPGEWDAKNMEEQEIVTQFISDCFIKEKLIPDIGEKFTKVTGNIEHICTPIEAKVENSDFNLESLLKVLSPTPALCGSPRDFALTEIEKLEKFPRGCYGGFCGPFRSVVDFYFHVTLRCASVSEKRYCIYAGGGITAKSSVVSEWEETEMKILNTFGPQ